MFLKVVKRFIVSLFLVGVLSTVLILNIPASFAPQLISFASRHELLPADSPQLELAQLSGSLWDGTAKESALLINDNVIDLIPRPLSDSPPLSHKNNTQPLKLIAIQGN